MDMAIPNWGENPQNFSFIEMEQQGLGREGREEGEELRAFLVVRAASHSDWGVYTCRAQNNIANNEAAVVLKGDKNNIISF